MYENASSCSPTRQSTVQLLSFHQAEWNNLSVVVVCIYLIMSEAQQLLNIPLLVNWSGLLSTFFGISGLLIFWKSVKWPFICEIRWHLFFDIYISKYTEHNAWHSVRVYFPLDVVEAGLCILPSPLCVCMCLVRTYNTRSILLTYLEVHNTVLLTIGTRFYGRSPELIHLV